MSAPYTYSMKVEVFVDIDGGEDDTGGIIANLAFNYKAGTSQWWCNYVGAYMPGDPPEVEVTGVTLARVNAKTGEREDLVCPDWLGEMIVAQVSEDHLVSRAEETIHFRNWEDA